jgi:hypothetical protein
MTELEPNSTLAASFLNTEKPKRGMSNIIYEILISKDGNAWCALLGADLQNGAVGYGKTVKEALHDLANNI